jgi:hypothetical protein
MVEHHGFYLGRINGCDKVPFDACIISGDWQAIVYRPWMVDMKGQPPFVVDATGLESDWNPMLLLPWCAGP